MRSLYRKYAINNPFIPVAILIILVIILGIICFTQESKASESKYPKITNNNPKIKYDESNQVVKPLVNNNKPDPKAIVFNSPTDNNYEDYDQDRIIYLPRNKNRPIIRRTKRVIVHNTF